MRAGQGIIVISITLLVLGVVMVNSAGMQVSQEHHLTLNDLLMSRPSFLAILAMLAMFIGSRFPTQLMTRSVFQIHLAFWLLLIAVILLLFVYVPGIGKEVNFGRRWVTIGSISFQPSEIAKWVMVLAVALWASTNADRMKEYWRGFIPPIACVGIVCAIIAIEDLGTGVLIFVIASILFLASGSRLKYFVSLLPVAIGGFAIAVIANPYRIGRLQSYLHPFADPDNSGYHILQSMNAIAGGGLSGLGLGNGIHKFGYLPEDTTDFIFAVICEELGIFGSVAVALLYIGLIVLGIVVIRKLSSTFEQLLVLGIMATIGLQAGMNILVVTAMIPTKGIALPLLSNGGTGWLLTAFCIGLVNAIDRKNENIINFSICSERKMLHDSDRTLQSPDKLQHANPLELM